MQTQYWDEEQLASWVVQSPDPKLYCPDVGQKLLIQWTLPGAWVGHAQLDIAILYRNHEREQSTLSLLQRKGTHTISLMNEDYLRTNGILSYRITLCVDGTPREVWEHPLWIPSK